jgi:predicted nucleic-acid-binding Zn-ribbon protein
MQAGKKCIKCETILTNSFLDSLGASNFSVIKKSVKLFLNKKSAFSPFVCSKCGYIEWYVNKPENFK